MQGVLQCPGRGTRRLGYGLVSVMPLLPLGLIRFIRPNGRCMAAGRHVHHHLPVRLSVMRVKPFRPHPGATKGPDNRKGLNHDR